MPRGRADHRVVRARRATPWPSETRTGSGQPRGRRCIIEGTILRSPAVPAQIDKASSFQALHAGPGSFVIPNPWDGGSARILEALGYRALATSSGASAGTLGRRDGKISRDEALAHCELIVASTDLPVSADLENGFGSTTADVAETYRLAAETGLVGASIEDATGDPGQPLFTIEEATARVAAAVEAVRGLPFHFTLTARAEGFLRGNTDLDDAIRRLKAYEAAGADVLFAPGLPDLDAVRAVCRSVSRPVNFMVGVPHRSFTVSDLTVAGVKRISLATSLYRAAMTGLLSAARETLEHGTFSYVESSVPGRELAGYLQD
ncbi:MAG: isocitrate lyase/phosphoenolpyruvate mutase family protein [Dehalococcoidia bacterium]|nr:isocitrate lyase/phosphoenolpyruvate mutase family protein [Dehalococcoidia bacterium]